MVMAENTWPCKLEVNLQTIEKHPCKSLPSMSYKVIYFVRLVEKGKILKTFLLVKKLFQPLDLYHYNTLICLVQLELRPLLERGMDLP